MKKISSVANSLVQQIIKLNTPKEVKKSGLCVVEGYKLVSQLYKAGIVKAILVQSSKLKTYNQFIKSVNNNVELIEINDAVAKKISNTITHAGIFALVKYSPKTTFDIKHNFIVLDQVQDPSNIGAILRNAMAFDIKNVVFINSAFPYVPKVIRSSMGYVFDVNIISMEKDELISIVKANNINLISAIMDGQDLRSFTPIKPYGLVVGNEGNGVSQELLSCSNQKVKISMKNNVESLNVATSMAIIMYELNNK